MLWSLVVQREPHSGATDSMLPPAYAMYAHETFLDSCRLPACRCRLLESHQDAEVAAVL